MQHRTIWACSVGLALACARPLPGPPVSSSDTSDAPGPADPPVASAPAKPPPPAPEPVHEVFCLEAPAEPIPLCSESRSAQLDLPLAWASYLDQRAKLLEVGGGVEPVPKPKRPDRWDAAFVEVEGGRVTKLVRADQAPPRSTFLAQAGGFHLRSSDRALSLWRDDGASLDLGVTNVGGGSLVAIGDTTAESVVVAYARFGSDEKQTWTRVIKYTSVRVTSGPSSEWSVSPWRSLTGAASPTLHVTERGVALTAFEPPEKEAQPSFVALWLSEADESKVERFPLAGPGWRVRELGGVARAGEQWLAVASIESEPVAGRPSGHAMESEPPVCSKPQSLPPPSVRSTRWEPGFSGGPQPGQGAIAVVSHGREGSRSLVLETGLLVYPGHLVQLDPSRVAVSFCTDRPDSCYLAVVSLDQGEGVLCFAPGYPPTPLAFEGESLLWVERRSRKTVQVNSSSALKGVALRKAQKPPARERPE